MELCSQEIRCILAVKNVSKGISCLDAQFFHVWLFNCIFHINNWRGLEITMLLIKARVVHLLCFNKLSEISAISHKHFRKASSSPQKHLSYTIHMSYRWMQLVCLLISNKVTYRYTYGWLNRSLNGSGHLNLSTNTSPFTFLGQQVIEQVNCWVT